MGLISMIFLGFSLYILFCVVVVCSPSKKHIIYDSKWYSDAGKKFEGDCYYPPCDSSSSMRADGIIIRTRQHYRPVRHSDYSPIFTKLDPWFKSYCVMDCGQERFMKLDFTEH